ncbi:hypothetical protein DPMN_038354 [Dreissena polymorpha]|uniref:Uncharacterized protein n=1 Tax=Dreissena polymorpha TaxID=45954 RepID=A0A9D4MCK5_DREPO|nr:hypothetical protein DPMN_038354 [Dreissena polymorpha]
MRGAGSQSPTRSGLITTADPPPGECTRIKGSKHMLMDGSWLTMLVTDAVTVLHTFNKLQ